MNNYKKAVSQIKDKIDIVSMFEKEGVSIISAGIGKYKCLCPFHSERTPSMVIYEDTQTYHCFGCGESGDVITFFEKKHVLNFKESVLELAKITGVELTEDDNSNTSNLSRQLEIVKIINEEFKKQYKILDNNHPAKQNIINRNLDPNEDWYGYAPKDNRYIIDILIKQGFKKEEMIDAGVLNKNGNLFFFDRLIFTINNYMNRPIAFSARQLKDDNYGKYINSPSSEVFDKSSSFYNIEKAKNKIKKENKVYITEGQFDVIAMFNNGYENTVATCGTSITEKHIKSLMNILNNGNIVFVMDGDKAGINALIKVFQNYPQIHTNAKVVIMPKGIDPCDYFRENQQLPKEVSLVGWIYNNMKLKLKGKSPEELINISNIAYNNFTSYIKNQNLKDQYENKIYTWANQKPPQKIIEETKQQTKKQSNIILDLLCLYSTNQEILKNYFNINDYPNNIHNVIKVLRKEIREDKLNNQEMKLLDYIYKNPNEMESENAIVNHYKYLLDYKNRR